MKKGFILAFVAIATAIAFLTHSSKVKSWLSYYRKGGTP